MKKSFTVLIFMLIVVMSCGCEVLPDASTSSSVTLSRTRAQIENYIISSIYEASSLDMSAKVRIHEGEETTEITFYYVCNQKNETNDFEMAMSMFLKVIHDEQDTTLHLSQAYLKDYVLYMSLLNPSDGDYDLYQVAFSPSEELVSLAGLNLFYSAPLDELFNTITQNLLTEGTFVSTSTYTINLSSVENNAGIKSIIVNPLLDQLTIYAEEYESNTKIEQEIIMIPGFGVQRISIPYPDEFIGYEDITLAQLQTLIGASA